MLDKEEIRWLKNTCNELNNLLQRIYGYAFLSVERTAPLPEVQESLGHIVDTVERASHVTQSMLDYVAACEEYANPRQPHPPATPYSPPTKSDTHAEQDNQYSQPDVLTPDPKTTELIPPPSSGLASASPTYHLTSDTFQSPSTSKQSQEPQQKQSERFTEHFATPENKPDAQTNEPDFLGIPIANPTGTKELIMVVDDEVEVGRIILAMLTEAGYRVIVAQDGFSAIQIYKKVGKAIDLVLLDFAMPLMDGEDVFDELRLINPNVAVILSSGFPQQAKLSSLLAKGLRGFMPKPYTRDKLVSQVSQALSLGVRSHCIRA